jgi:hypothetical protein
VKRCAVAYVTVKPIRCVCIRKERTFFLRPDMEPRRAVIRAVLLMHVHHPVSCHCGLMRAKMKCIIYGTPNDLIYETNLLLVRRVRTRIVLRMPRAEARSLEFQSDGISDRLGTRCTTRQLFTEPNTPFIDIRELLLSIPGG